MKRILTLVAAMTLTVAISAQSITFGDVALTNENLPASWSNGNVKLVLTNDGKPTVDLNSTNFGTEDAYENYVSRLKTGGKSSANRYLTLTVPSDGTVKIAARTGSNSDVTRTIVLTQNDNDLVIKTLVETEAISIAGGENTIKIYPYVVADVKAGDIIITFPVNGINIYGIEFVSASTSITKPENNTTTDAVYNLAGQQVGGSYKGVVISNGKKYIQK